MPIHSQTCQAPTRAQAGGQWAEVGFWGPGLGDKRPGGCSGGGRTAGAPRRGQRPICFIDKVATGCHDDTPGPRRMCWRQGQSPQSPPAQPPGWQLASDAKEVPHTCSWASTHRPAATRGTRQTPRGPCTHCRAPTKAETRRPHGEARLHPRQTPREAPAPRAAHETHAHPEARRARQPASPGRPHQTLFTCGPGNPSAQAPSECVHVCVKRDHLRGPSPAPTGQRPLPTTPTKPRLSAQDAGLQPQPAPLTWRDGGRMQYWRDTPLPSAPPRSGQHPDHLLDIQAWGSPTAIAAGCGPGVGGAGASSPESQTVILKATSRNLSGDPEIKQSKLHCWR